ncbi:MAG: HD domain-containing protein [Dysgonamonadaceae bacterium]|nr:HD domain-containing protein [Dysgonamonadaceae bacterium]
MEKKRKIINDPVFGFINIPNEFIYEIIKHPYLQRLNRIRQLGLASFVYPGAQHTRLHHSIGAMYLMNEAVNQLRLKGHLITQEESESVIACILMHDIGHGPFSHVLENTLVNDIHHEEISLMMMNRINRELGNRLDTAIAIFQDRHPKKFLHQLVSGQLDMDRLDYLRRDSFFTGVIEGNIGSARIIKMLNIKNDRLVVEAKGIYSIENFLMSRRLMYWQVYLHKTAIAAEKMLINTLKRAKHLAGKQVELFASPALRYFLYTPVDRQVFQNDPQALENFANLDDNDIWCALKVWTTHPDIVLSTLSKGIVHRNLFKIEIKQEPFAEQYINDKILYYAELFGISGEDAAYFVSSDEVSTNMYSEADDSIAILYNDGSTVDIAEASDMLNIQLLSKKIKKYYFCFLRYSK